MKLLKLEPKRTGWRNLDKLEQAYALELLAQLSTFYQTGDAKAITATFADVDEFLKDTDERAGNE